MGWLQVTPNDHKEARHEVFGWVVPVLASGEELHDVWRELGFAGMVGEVAVSLSWQEMMAYAKMTQTELSVEEWRVVWEMSEAYATELRNRAPLAKSPMDKAAMYE